MPSARYSSCASVVVLISRGVLSLTLAAASLLACDSVTDSDGGFKNLISPNLLRVMYWGYVAADHWEPNSGVEIGNIFHPVWFADDSIFVHTAMLDHGVDVVGIFSVAMDPATRSLRRVQSYAFAGTIRDYDYDVTTRDFVLTFSETPGEIKAARARLSGDNLVLTDDVRDESWFPLCARFDANGDGIFLYAHDPATLINGFYFASRNNPSQDSLVHAVELGVAEARGFDVAGGVLCFGQTDFTGAAKTTISVVDLSVLGAPRLVATLPGAFISASVHPAGTCAIIALNDMSLPGDVVGLLDLHSGLFTKLDVRTRVGAAPIADFASWNPTANAFAFSGAGFNGEGALYPRQLWIRASTFCQ